MTRFRVVATDLDGTLLDGQRRISNRTLEGLRFAVDAGARVVIVTARPPRYIDALADAYGLSGTAVCSNGAVVYDIVSRAVVASRTLSSESARRVAGALLRSVPDVGFALETGHKVLYAPEFGMRHAEDARAESAVACSDELWLAKEPIVKLLAWSPSEDADAMRAVADKTVGPLCSVTHSGGAGLLEIGAPGVTKAATLSELCNGWDVDAAAVVAFGDMPNDLSMLSWAGAGYAMANAHPQVLATVSRHTGSNEDDGVAAVLEQLFAEHGRTGLAPF
ncbi:Cof-type HAD-IIB family hydrolase (plasmid) [Kitasatospora sp. NBC_00070]|uniref:HAD family hydrolase n=1 Tax=Kitasatospora sp. NBC_00070 TaxID=2975962 RepID=UPI002F919444